MYAAQHFTLLDGAALQAGTSQTCECVIIAAEHNSNAILRYKRAHHAQQGGVTRSCGTVNMRTENRQLQQIKRPNPNLYLLLLWEQAHRKVAAGAPQSPHPPEQH